VKGRNNIVTNTTCPKCSGTLKLDDEELSCIMCGMVIYLEYRKLRIDDDSRTDKTNVGEDEESRGNLDGTKGLAVTKVWNRRTPQYYSTMVRQGGVFRN
tara:strand:- start:8 stop:304 length:297 start_codon:yes stop_codon:yes gene_type:complete